MSQTAMTFQSPTYPEAQEFRDIDAAFQRIKEIYDSSQTFLRSAFLGFFNGEVPKARCRAYYPEVRIKVDSYATVDTRLSFGYVAQPGTYRATLTRPTLFEHYLKDQLALLIEHHDVPIEVRVSEMEMPVHFAMESSDKVSGLQPNQPLRDVFDVPQLDRIDDDVVNVRQSNGEGDIPALSLFTALRIDYSLARLEHYTATAPEHFQNHVLFTNYQFYVDEFLAFAHEQIQEKGSGYTEMVEPGNLIHGPDGVSGAPAAKLPQMPTYHLKRKDGQGITLVNIGVGPSNAKTITDHIAVLRPHAWIMVGHCAGLRNSQALGDYVLAHAYVREDHVLDDDLPTWVPIPALAEIQVALEQAVEDVTGMSGFERKKVMRTGTVATIDNRNWELREQSGPVQRLSQSRAIGLDMESATIAANGFRFRVPYGTLLCVSDKPLHGELKLPGMATDFYQRQVAQHLHIGIKAMEQIRDMPLERLQSRKLRSFDETAFL